MGDEIAAIKASDFVIHDDWQDGIFNQIDKSVEEPLKFSDANLNSFAEELNLAKATN